MDLAPLSLQKLFVAVCGDETMEVSGHEESVARNLRCQWKPMAQCLGLAGGLTAFLCLCCVFCAPIDAIARTVMVCFGPFAAASWLMIGIGMSINFYTQSAFLYLMMGTTRAGIFVVRQLANLLFCAVGALAVTAGLAAMGCGPRECMPRLWHSRSAVFGV